MAKDDILGDDFFDELNSDEIIMNEDETLEEDIPESKYSIPVVDLSSHLPKLVGDNVPKDYQCVIDRFISMYMTLPIINYDAIHKELSELNVDSSPTPTLQLINLKLQRVQASKDRLAEIYQQVIRCYTFKKRAVNVLSEAWNKFAEGSSADKRKSDSSFRLSEFHADLAQVEALYSVCEHILRNLDSQSNSISRQITIIQSQLKMFDMGRGALPDFDFNKSALNEGFESLGTPVESENNENNNELDVTERRSAEELSF
jgi:hypothetical protein